MKRMILCIVILLALAEGTMAQVGKNKNTAKKSTFHNGNSIKKSIKQKDTSAHRNVTYTLTSTGKYNAFASPQPTRFRISDPIIGTLNAKAKGSDIKISSSGIVGVPKGTYGFAHGKVIFYPSGATSSGTSPGSGSVGTGTGPGGVGMFGPAIGVNGKSPFTGTGAYGVRIPLVIETVSDTSNSTGIRKH